jgi:hypothetical protein
MRRTLLAGLALCLLAAPTFAGELAGVTLPDPATVGEQQMVLNGLGLRKKLFIKIYVGGLYLPAKEANADKVLGNDASRRMVMSFLYGVSASQMCDAWEAGLEMNTPNPGADVAVDEDVARVALQRGQALEVARVRQRVEVDDGLADGRKPVEDEVGADEAGAAGDENHSNLSRHALAAIMRFFRRCP